LNTRTRDFGAVMATQESNRDSPRKSSSGKARSRTAAKQRPSNAEELSPETLLPDLVQTDLQRVQLDEESRHARIAERAHELAKQRGFAPGGELEDWLQAERDVDRVAGPQVPPENQFTG
jgi:hypothetical protein